MSTQGSQACKYIIKYLYLDVPLLYPGIQDEENPPRYLQIDQELYLLLQIDFVDRWVQPNTGSCIILR